LDKCHLNCHGPGQAECVPCRLAAGCNRPYYFHVVERGESFEWTKI